MKWFLKTERCTVIVWFTNQKKGVFSLAGPGYKNRAVQTGSGRKGWDQRKVRRSIAFKPSWHHVEHSREMAGIRLIDSGLSDYLIVDYQLAEEIGNRHRGRKQRCHLKWHSNLKILIVRQTTLHFLMVSWNSWNLTWCNTCVPEKE